MDGLLQRWPRDTVPRIDPDIGPSLRSRFRKCNKIKGLWSSRPERYSRTGLELSRVLLNTH